MGRPSLGTRRQVNVRLPIELVRSIDAARGMASRDSWIEKAARLALRPTSVFTVPGLKQDVHVCDFSKMIETTWQDGVRMRRYACDCGAEETR